jgi:phage shock protein A
MLGLSHDHMLDHLTKVRQALVRVAASGKQIGLRQQRLRHSADRLRQQAKRRWCPARRTWRGRCCSQRVSQFRMRKEALAARYAAASAQARVNEGVAGG